MKIGFYLKWNKGSLASKVNVIGDELLSEQLCEALRSIKSIAHAHLYAANEPPPQDRCLDVMVYMNDTPLNQSWAKKHVAYMQNNYPAGADIMLKQYQDIGYDGYLFISQKLLGLHQYLGGQGIYLPFGVNRGLFNPRPSDSAYRYEVAYVGSDIKGPERTMKYLLPATQFNLGLYGYWYTPATHWWQFKARQHPWYVARQKLAAFSRGRIAQEDVPVLYSSAAINLNFTAMDCVNWEVVTLRTMEVLACKGFLITDYVPPQDKALREGVVLTEGDRDMVDKIRYYLDHPEARLAIADKGYEYVVRYGSVEQRAKELVAYLETLV